MPCWVISCGFRAGSRDLRHDGVQMVIFCDPVLMNPKVHWAPVLDKPHFRPLLKQISINSKAPLFLPLCSIFLLVVTSIIRYTLN
jgi:hypothetical protein